MKTIALNTTANVTAAAYIIRRVAGVWSAMGTGCNEQVHQIVVDPANGTVYACGIFTLAGGVANTVYLAKWDGAAWTPLGVGLNGAAYCMAVAPNGDVYIGGTFTDIVGGGGGTYNKIIMWDVSGSTWAAVGAGLDGDVDALAIDSVGDVYAGGDFGDLLGGGLANANFIAKWDISASAWVALGTGMNAAVADLAVDTSDNVYAVGAFTTGNAVTLNYVGMWNGTTFVAMAGDETGADAACTAVVVASNGLVYVSGNTDDFGGTAAAMIASWNGATFTALGDGLQASADDLALDDDGNLYAVGGFTTAGGMAIAARIAMWNGSIWAPIDIDLPGAPTPQALCIFGDRLFIGFDTTGTATTSGEPASTITNSTTMYLYPKFIFTRSGGTTAVLESIRNLTTGKQLLFNHSLLDGEEVTIDLAPGKKTIQTIAGSSTSSAKRDMLASSDIATFALAPGVNDIRTYISVTGAPTLGAFVQWEQRYSGIDGAAA